MVLQGDLFQLAIADIVAVVAQAVNSQDTLDEGGRMLVHGVDVKLHEQLLGALFPHIVYRQIDQEVVVGLAHLQEALTPFYILHEEGGIAPDAVGRTHVDGSIELPPWPRVVLGGIAGAMEEDMIDTCSKHQVEVGFHLRQRGAEVLC